MNLTGVTPAGATLFIRRSRSKVIFIEIDRWSITSATTDQCAKVREIALNEIRATGAMRESGAHGGSYLAQPSIWIIPTTRDREDAVLDALFAIEAEGNQLDTLIRKEADR